MNFHVISALVMRYLFLYARTPMRLVELIFWPLVDLVVWGNVTVFIQRHSNEEFGSFVLFFIGAMILWDVLFRAQQGVAISFLEDVWTRNLLNVFVAPVRTTEYVGATFVVGFLRILVTVVVMSLVSWIGYSFNIFQLQWWLAAVLSQPHDFRLGAGDDFHRAHPALGRPRNHSPGPCHSSFSLSCASFTKCRTCPHGPSLWRGCSPQLPFLKACARSCGPEP
ncbi:MAG: ABC transporter permease [Prosthecobacter sp.]